MAKQPRRPRAETPKGFRDLFGAEVVEREAMLGRIAAVYRAHGFDPLETSAVETVEALGKFLPDVDRPNEGVFAWQEEPESDGDWLALRYDLTAPLARVYAQHRAQLPTPYRRYAMGPVWRNEKPGPGRFRQFTQCDADTVGAASVAADAEIVAMLCEALGAAGIARGDYVVKVNSRKVLNGVLEAAGLLRPDDPEAFSRERGVVLRAIDKLDRLGLDGIRALLGPGRRDESGDVTPGAGLADEQVDLVCAFLGFGMSFAEGRELRRSAHLADTPNDGSGVIPQVLDLIGMTNPNARVLESLSLMMSGSQTGAAGCAELATIADLLASQGFGPDRIIIDPSTVRGLGYYTGPVFEAELTFEVLGDDGRPRQFGSVAGGGRYDDLVRRFTGEAVPATGVSIGVDRLLAALRARRKAAEAPYDGPVVVTVMDRDRVGDSLALAAELRRAGIRAEAFLGNPKGFGHQMKYADRRRAPFVLIEGSDERARGVVQVKDMAAGARAAETATLEEWKGRPAQAEVARGEVAAHLRRLLA